jgi:hypothetical protein
MTRRVYLVQRRAVSNHPYAPPLEGHTAHPCGAFLPWKPLRLFADESAALAFADEVRRSIRAEVNPFDYCLRLDLMTGLPSDDFRLKVVELGLPLPPEEGHEMAGWWFLHVRRMTEEQRDGVWELLVGLELVRVTPLTLGG